MSTTEEELRDQSALPAGMGRVALDHFEGLKIMDGSAYEKSSREECEICKGMYRYHCFKCARVPAARLSVTPRLSLPISLTVLLHYGEKRSKSTGMHAVALAPEDAELREFPRGDPSAAFTGLDPVTTVVLFPRPDAKPVSEIAREKQIRRVIAIDSTWQKAGAVHRALSERGFQFATMDTYETGFWRTQTVGNHCLATIEAIYYFYREYHTARYGEYHGEYDNLLFYFYLMYHRIQYAYSIGESHAGSVGQK